MKTREPVAVVNTSIAGIEALIAVAVGFGVQWTPAQVGLLMAVVVAMGNLVKTLWARGQVTPMVDPRRRVGARRRGQATRRRVDEVRNVANGGANGRAHRRERSAPVLDPRLTAAR